MEIGKQVMSQNTVGTSSLLTYFTVLPATGMENYLGSRLEGKESFSVKEGFFVYLFFLDGNNNFLIRRNAHVT